MKIQALNLLNRNSYQAKTLKSNQTSFGANNIEAMKLSAGAIEDILARKELFGDTFTFLMNPDKKSMLVEIMTFSIRDRQSQEVISILKELQVLVDKTRKDFELTILGSSPKDREKILKKIEETAKEDETFLGEGCLGSMFGIKELESSWGKYSSSIYVSNLSEFVEKGIATNFSDAITFFIDKKETDKAKIIIRAIADNSVIYKGINEFFAKDVEADLRRQLLGIASKELNSISAATLNTGANAPNEYFAGLIALSKAYPSLVELEKSITPNSRNKAFAEALKPYLPKYHLIPGVI